MFNKEDSNKRIVFALGCLLGALVFIWFYGIRVLDVTYDSWLMEGGDLSQHYIGWQFFRNSSWSFPFIGLIDGLIYPYKVSVIYMDTIPGLSIIFKILSPILPQTFQYFGIWGILCFMLQGGIGALIIRKFTSQYIICIASSMLFLLSPIMIYRLFGHASLAGHWLILLSIYIILNKSKFRDIKKSIGAWSIIVFLCVNVHMYFLAITMLLLLCYLAIDYFENKSIARVISVLGSSIFIALITLFILGAFYGSADYETVGLGFYSANINALFNPQGYSRYLFNLPTATEGQYEGLAYIGLGVIIALIVALYFDIENVLKIKNEKISIFIKNNYIKFIIFITMIIFFIIALSPQVSLNGKMLLNIPYPKIIIKFLNVFRSTGRFMWPICYFIVIYAIRKILNISVKKQAIIFILICVIIQMSDLSNTRNDRYDRFSHNIEYNSEIKSPLWYKLIKNNYKHIAFMKYTVQNYKSLWSLCKYAADNNLTMNDGYVSRKDSKAVNAIKDEYLQQLESGICRDDTIYVFGNDQNILESLKDYPLSYYNLDGIIVGIKEKFTDINDYREEHEEKLKQGINILPKEDKYMNYGRDTDKGRILNPQGRSFGPYSEIAQGTYNVVIEGENLNKIVKYDLCYKQGEKTINLQEIERNNEKIVFTFNLETDIQDLECRVVNGNDENVILTKIVINKIVQ
ncbi:DUF6311 domain-containing protein [Clostridium beijerinckii]|uniref:DUF6311 domain-containing protein n=1 Tax=Clostridium beijerinckii TaxID=1520 RepID=UPI000A1C7976|nr:DUF6311 domain-containing protein [Clostridium beijerinckii]CUU50757.1 conserved membrane protein of unknown function [Clostridium beijerinckii]